jgi:hypothetical protein
MHDVILAVAFIGFVLAPCLVAGISQPSNKPRR